jgi:hypothetical protein
MKHACTQSTAIFHPQPHICIYIYIYIQTVLPSRLLPWYVKFTILNVFLISTPRTHTHTHTHESEYDAISNSLFWEWVRRKPQLYLLPFKDERTSRLSGVTASMLKMRVWWRMLGTMTSAKGTMFVRTLVSYNHPIHSHNHTKQIGVAVTSNLPFRR